MVVLLFQAGFREDCLELVVLAHLAHPRFGAGKGKAIAFLIVALFHPRQRGSPVPHALVNAGHLVCADIFAPVSLEEPSQNAFRLHGLPGLRQSVGIKGDVH